MDNSIQVLHRSRSLRRCRRRLSLASHQARMRRQCLNYPPKDRSTRWSPWFWTRASSPLAPNGELEEDMSWTRRFYDCYLSSDHRFLVTKNHRTPTPPSQMVMAAARIVVTTQGSSRGKELKQLDREIPWRQLLKLPREQLELYVESAVKEAKSWFQWDSVEPLTPEQVKEVLASPKLRKRILRSRAVYRDKARGQGPLRAKCRVVCLGHLDPDLKTLTRESPTPTELRSTLCTSS